MKKIVVVGAGILGASAAYHLAKGGADVVIIDRQDEGQATDAAAGIICPWLSQRRNKAWYALAKGGAAFYPNLIKSLEEDGELDTGYKQVGAISLHTEDDKIRKMEERALVRREDAPEIGKVQKMDQLETTSLFPPLSDEFSSIHVSGAARVNGHKLRIALLHAAKKYGAKWIHGNAILEKNGEGRVCVQFDGVSREADMIIVTAGAWAPELLSAIGVELQISPQKAQIVHLQLDEKKTADWPVVMPPGNHYILAFDAGKVIIGATHEDDKGFDLRVTAGGLNEVINKALKVAPGLADGMFAEARVGFRPVAPGFLPIIGPVPGFNNLLLANGLGSSGLTVGPLLGYQLAKLALGEEADIDMGLYEVESAIKR